VEHRGQTLAYIEVTKADIAQANEIAHEVLGRTLDELPPQTRTLLMLVRDWVQGQCIEHGITQADWRFTRKQVRAATHWGDTQLKVHLARLVELEHLALHRKGLSHEYELVYDAQAGADRPHLNGLLDADDLGNAEGHAYDRDRSGLSDDRSASGRGLVGGVSALGRDAIECEQTQQPCGLQGDESGVNGHDAANALFRQDGKSPVVAVAARA
jgi:DNA primase